MKRPSLPSSLFFIIFTIALLQLGEAIDCFKCISLNGNFPACDDPFHNNVTKEILESPCMGGRKGRDGLFPATACIKLSGKYAHNGHSITVRGCALDSGGITVDTEIIRMSHCGHFVYDVIPGYVYPNNYVHGCLQSCSDADACNGAPRRPAVTPVALMCSVATLLVTPFTWR